MAMGRVALCILCSVSIRAHSDVRSCAQILMGRASQYAGEVYQSKGLRLFLKPAKENGRGIYDFIVRKSVARVSSALGLGRLEPSLPLLFLATGLAWSGVDVVSQTLYEQKIQGEIAAQSEGFDELLLTDFRFRHIAERLVKKEIDHAEALQEVFWLKMAFDLYYRQRELHKNETPTVASEMAYLPVFIHLKPVIEEGVHPKPGFIVPSGAVGPLSDEQIIRLFEINHDLFLDYQRVVEKLQSENPSGTDSFSTSVIELWKNKTISQGAARMALQEESFWRHRMAEWEVIGVQRLNVRTGAPLRLLDLRQEILNDLKDRSL